MSDHEKQTDGSEAWANFSKNLVFYQKPNLQKSWWQIINTFVPYVGVWILLAYSISISLWLTAFLVILEAGLLVRLFIIFHDCGHGSFFKSPKTNRMIGMLFGILAFTPYDKWHFTHMKHHATVGNLDKRGMGDVWTMTKAEYLSSSKRKRLYYRVYRHPLAMFGIGSLYVFVIQNRFTNKWMTAKQKQNVYFTNLMLLLLTAIMGLLIGFFTFVILQLLIIYVAAIAGLWLFYLQHQYENVSWVRNEEWNYIKLALEGSSFVKFPKLLQWFSGNIGFHHIHHINPRIPNYNLPRCYSENAIFKKVKPVTFLGSIRTLRLRLWDEKHQKLVGFAEI